MTKKLCFNMKKIEPGDKDIVIIGPSDGFYPIKVTVDYDDVNHPVTKIMAKQILNILNENWEEKK